MLDARFSHLYFCQSLDTLQRGLSAIAELLVLTYRVAQKLAPFLYALTLPSINRFSKLFYCQNQDKIIVSLIIVSLKIPHHTSSVSLHYLVKCQVS